jgi:hypothetical protein
VAFLFLLAGIILAGVILAVVILVGVVFAEDILVGVTLVRVTLAGVILVPFFRGVRLARILVLSLDSLILYCF